MDRFLSLAVNTFLETIRQPIYGVILVATAGMMVLNVSLAGFTLTMDGDDKLLMDLGLSTLLLSGLFLSAFSAAGVLSREIENKTVLTVISKPVGRPTFFLGKYAGLAAALAVAHFLSSLVFLLAQRHGVMSAAADPWDLPVLLFGFGGALLAFVLAAYCNYFYGMGFAATMLLFVVPILTVGTFLTTLFDEHFKLIPFLSNFPGGQVIVATYLVFLVSLMLAAVALAASARCGQVMTLVICVGVLAFGIASDYAFGQRAEDSNLAAVAYAVIPNVGPFWIIDGLTRGSTESAVTGTYVLSVTAYAALVITAILGLGVALFQRRELG
jgi:ABC-type transport system involved in multi-copper enzyme maturation permease subunit